jgi:ligand-binding sensor protein
MHYSYLDIVNLIDLKKWQQIQDNFSVVTDVGLRLVDAEGGLITKPSGQPRLCRELLKNHSSFGKACTFCLPTFLGGTGVVDKNLHFLCPHSLELHNFVAPLVLNSRVMAYYIIGPLALGNRKPKNEYEEIARESNLDLEELWSAILEIKVISFNSAQSLTELIKDLGEYTLKLSYQNRTREKESIMALGSPRLSKFLETLLDVAFEISGADIGSVMFLNKDTNDLTIKASKGIPDDVVKSTRVKLGSPLSGLAAAEGRSILLDTDTSDNRLTPYLKRPQINSSMIIPLKIEDDVVGVMNIGALDTSSVRFTQKNLNLMARLVDLTTLAIHT